MGTWRLDCWLLRSTEPDEVEFVVSTLEFFFIEPTRSKPCPPLSFHSAAISILVELFRVHRGYYRGPSLLSVLLASEMEGQCQFFPKDLNHFSRACICLITTIRNGIVAGRINQKSARSALSKNCKDHFGPTLSLLRPLPPLSAKKVPRCTWPMDILIER